MTRLLLVRHASTAWTESRRLQGRRDIDLSTAGLADAAALRPLVDSWAPATVIVSPLSRARTTAALLSDLEPIVDDRWMEADLGHWEGLVGSELGPGYLDWRAGRVDPPGGEALVDLRHRVAEAVRDAASRPGPVLVVTHGGTIRAALAQFVGLRADRIDPPAAPSLTVLDVDDAGARLRQYNLGARTSA